MDQPKLRFGVQAGSLSEGELHRLADAFKQVYETAPAVPNEKAPIATQLNEIADDLRSVKPKGQVVEKEEAVPSK